jgi:hypothetical protein
VVIGGEVGSYTISRGTTRVRYRGKEANAVGGGSSLGKRECGGDCSESDEVTAAPPVGCGHNVECGGSESRARFGSREMGMRKKGAMTTADSFYTAATGRGWGGGGGGWRRQDTVMVATVEWRGQGNGVARVGRAWRTWARRK